jgi:hypothetical protein
MFLPSKHLYAGLATMAFPSVEQQEPGVPVTAPRKAPTSPGQGGRALMEDVEDDDDLTLKDHRLWDKGAGTITPGPNTGPAMQVSSHQVRAMSSGILAGLNLIQTRSSK